MFKKNYPYIIILIVIIFIGGYYLLGQKPQENSNINNNSENLQESNQNNNQQSCEGEECEVGASEQELLGAVIDGIIQRLENDYLEIGSSLEEEGKKIVLNEETKYYEITFDSEFNVVDEKEIEKKEVKVGSNASVSAHYKADSPEEKVASAVKVIIINK